MKATGLPICPGIVFGKAFVFCNPSDSNTSIEADLLEDLKEKEDAFQRAVDQAHEQLLSAMNSIEDKGSDAYTILDAHLTLLHDEAINEDIRFSLASGHCVSTAINETFDAYNEILRNLKEISPKSARRIWTISDEGCSAASQEQRCALSGT